MKLANADIIVIGAGIAGLMAARILEKQGAQVMVLDKGYEVGGRLATRQIGPGLADLGAQFFTTRSQEFQNWVHQWQYEKVVYLWSMGFSHGSVREVGDSRHSRYAVFGGMNRLAQHIASDLDHIYTNTQVVTVTATGEDWLIQDQEGELYTAKGVIMTPPIPQSLEMLHAGATRLSEDDQIILDRIAYAPCLCGLFWVDGALHLPDPGAIQFLDGPISWIANGKQKGISPEATILTVHASPEYSQQLWLSPDNVILEALRNALKPYLESQTKIREAQLKRWRYALALNVYDAPCLVAEGLPPLAFAGDAFGMSNVEGAVLSGTAAAKVLFEMLAAGR